jgi:atypical dual specificity phosphatase
MNGAQPGSLLWWLIPGVLAGMPMPFIHANRRMAGGGAWDAYDDELRELHQAGVQAVVSLLNLPGDAPVYESAGIAFLCLPVANGEAPTREQVAAFLQFMAVQRAAQKPVVVHCEGGIGRTGTMLAAYLISQGATAEAAINQVRAVESAAIETERQVQFLEDYELHHR